MKAIFTYLFFFCFTSNVVIGKTDITGDITEAGPSSSLFNFDKCEETLNTNTTVVEPVGDIYVRPFGMTAPYTFYAGCDYGFEINTSLTYSLFYQDYLVPPSTYFAVGVSINGSVPVVWKRQRFLNNWSDEFPDFYVSVPRNPFRETDDVKIYAYVTSSFFTDESAEPPAPFSGKPYYEYEKGFNYTFEASFKQPIRNNLIVPQDIGSFASSLTPVANITGAGIINVSNNYSIQNFSNFNSPISFSNITECGTIQFYLQGTYGCFPYSTAEFNSTDKIEIPIRAPKPVVVAENFLGQTRFTISNPHKNVGYQWFKSKPNTQDWDNMGSGEFASFSEAGTYKVKYIELKPGCGTNESDVFTVSTIQTQKPNQQSTSVLQAGIKSFNELVPNWNSTIGSVHQPEIEYYDELGRPTYKATIKAGKGQEDISQFFEYDEWGRQKYSYLPYAKVQTSPGAFDANARNNQAHFYSTNPEVAKDARPFSTLEFDDTKDLSKVLKSYGPGNAWKLANKFTSQDGYLFKASDFVTQPVFKLFWAYPTCCAEKAMTDNNGGSQTYLDQELIVKESKSEDDQFSYSFINMLGQTVATRVMPRISGSSEKPLTTYYVYDDFGRLRMKIPPKVSALFGNSSSVLYGGGSFLQLAPDVDHIKDVVNALCTRYEYDDKGRLIKEFKPDGGYVETVYDIMNRPVMSQDQSQRLTDISGEANKWSFVKYDRMGRQILTGEIDLGYHTYNINTTRKQLQDQADLATKWFESRNNQADFQGYSNDAFPLLSTNSVTLLTVDYYDNYEFKTGNSFSENPFDPTTLDWDVNVLGPKPKLCQDLQGMQTGHKVRVLGSQGAGEWLLDVMVYDEKERLIATGSDNGFVPDGLANEDWKYTQYDNVYGQVLTTYSKHTNRDFSGEFPGKVFSIKRYEYDNRHQLEKITMVINGGEPKELVAYEYDVFGNIKTKHLCGKLQHLDLKHDIRGRLTYINDPARIGSTTSQGGGVPGDADIFGMRLFRENIQAGGLAHSSATSIQTGFPESRFDGSITGQQWKSLKDEIGRSYSYNYDNFNRVEGAIYRAKPKDANNSQWGTLGPDYHMFNIGYDENGNFANYKPENTQNSGGWYQTGPPLRPEPGQTPSTATAHIDHLTYTYEQKGNIGTNKLIKVTDDASNKTYDPLGPGEQSFRRDFNASEANYTYDDAGRLMSDDGKKISKITYNLLDLPEKIEFQNGSIITTTYAADGRKLKYEYQSGTTGYVVTTMYAFGFQYRFSGNSSKQPILFLNTEVGKAVFMEKGAEDTWLHQYHIYDHQGNLRVAFQESFTKGHYEAGMEQVNSAKEEEEFSFVAETREQNTLESRTGQYVAELNPLEGKPMGPMKWIPVEKGDTVSMESYAHFKELAANQPAATWQNSLAGFLVGSLANSIYSNIGEGAPPNAAMQQLILLGSTLLANPGIWNSADPSLPRAYMKWIHYDKDSQFISQGIIPISEEAKDGYQLLELQKIAEQDGFVQFFVANETTMPVYFDDIAGTVRRPKIIQEGHYSPFGLPLAGITTLGNPEYAYFFTGKELYEDEALQWYDYGARMYDVQIGRWTSHDPVYQDASPYVFCGNNGVNYVDPTGMFWDEIGDFFSDVGDFIAENQYWLKPVAALGLVVGGVAVGLTLGWTGVGGWVSGSMILSGGLYFVGVADMMINGVDDGNGGKKKLSWKEANEQAVFTLSIRAPIGGNGTNPADKKQLQKNQQQTSQMPSGNAYNGPGSGYSGAGGSEYDANLYASNDPAFGILDRVPLLYKDQTKAYNEMWNNSFRNGVPYKESNAFLTGRGVLVFPQDRNTEWNADYTNNNIKYLRDSDGSLSGLIFNGEKYSIHGSIHTHLHGTGYPSPEDQVFAKVNHPNRPMYIISSEETYMYNYKGNTYSKVGKTNDLLLGRFFLFKYK